MIRNFFTAEQLGPAYSELKNDLRLGTPTAVYGVSAPHKCLIAPLSWEGRLVYITDNALSAASCAAQIAGFTGEEPALLTAKDEVLLYKDAVSKDALFKRDIYSLDKRPHSIRNTNKTRLKRGGAEK